MSDAAANPKATATSAEAAPAAASAAATATTVSAPAPGAGTGAGEAAGPAAGAAAGGAGEEAVDDGSGELPASLYVGELNTNVTEAVLFEIFSSVGPVTSIRVCRDAINRESLGYAYVNFQSGADAKRAMNELNYAQIAGRPCRIMWSQRDPSTRKSGKGNIFIKNLDPSIDNKALHDTFSDFGDILSCKVVTNAKGVSQGFGFIHFATAEAADEAIETVNGMVMNGSPVYVAHHVSRAERESQAEAQRANFTNVFVKNLSEEIDDEELKKIFSEFGEITSAVLSKTEDGKSKGFGFVNFSTHAAAQKAVDELNDKEIKGKNVYVGRAQNRFERQKELKKKHDAQRQELLTKYQGVNLYVKNLDDDIDSEKLKESFAPFGTITSARVMTDDQGKSRGFGFVCYSSPEEANRAISEMNQNMLGSKPLYVALAQRRDVRTKQMRQQITAQHHLQLQQQAAAAGIPGAQFVGGAPMLYPGQPGVFSGAQARVFPGQPMMVPRGVPAAALGQWQQGPPKPGQRMSQPQLGPAAVVPASAAAAAAAAAAPKPESLEKAVAGLPEDEQKQVIGEHLYPRILMQDGINHELAAKITGMLLDMDNKELFALEKDEAALKEQIAAALEAYDSFVKQQNKS